MKGCQLSPEIPICEVPFSPRLGTQAKRLRPPTDAFAPMKYSDAKTWRLALVAAVSVATTAVSSGSVATEIARVTFSADQQGNVFVDCPAGNAQVSQTENGGKIAVEPGENSGDEAVLSLEAGGPKSGQYIDLGFNGDVLNVQDSFSVSFRVSLKSPGTTDCVVSVAAPDHPVFGVVIWDGVLRASLFDSEGNEAFISGAAYRLKPGEWYHVVVTFDAADRTLTAYLNGTPAGSTQVAGAVSRNSGNWILGIDRGGNWPASIRLQDVRFFRSALTPNEVVELL
jgi:hypothetical protein